MLKKKFNKDLLIFTNVLQKVTINQNILNIVYD